MKNSLFKYLSAFILVLITQVGYSQADQSVLNTGDWYKIPVLEDGVYRIDREYLVSLGLDVANIDPQNVAIYGNAINGMLPQSNSAPRADDLIENAIFIEGESDSKFDENDFLLFYGKSPHHLSFNDQKDNFFIEKNVYADTAFYFLTVKSQHAKRIAESDNSKEANSYASSYLQAHVHELDQSSLISYGRHWYGEKFNSLALSYQLDFAVPNRIAGSEIAIYTQLLSTSKSPSSFDIKVNGSAIKTLNIPAATTYEYGDKAEFSIDTLVVGIDQVGAVNPLSIDVSFNRSDNNSNGFIDYMHIITESHLDLTFDQISWFQQASVEGYMVSGSEEKAQIWDITDLTSPKAVLFSQASSTTKFGATESSYHFVAFNPSQAYIPANGIKIANQNLHALPSADGIIVTHHDFVASAQRLANFRTAHDGLLVEVVTMDQINNEFASGRGDISAIRDFLKMQYDRHGQLKYVLLWGDGSYDFRGVRYGNSNLVPVYEARNSYNRLRAFSSDDYFGFMEEGEGQWEESLSGDHTLELGIGRYPIHSNEDGEAIVNKIIRYQTNKLGFGKWRNTVTFVADDGQAGDKGNSNRHQTEANKLSVLVDTTQRALYVKKLYMDTYVQDKTSNSSERATRDFLRLFSDGSLMINYTGHGNEGVLTDDKLYNEGMTKDFSNNIVMPFLITATCQFGNYDNPGRTSGGEQIILHPQGGAIGMFTSTRPVNASTNDVINLAFYQAVVKKEMGQFRRLGNIFIDTKNNSLKGTANRNYALLADPMMRLNFPEYQVSMTHINGQVVSEMDTLSALGTYKISGEVNHNGNLITNFNGVVTITVLGKPRKFETLGDEGGAVMTFEQRDVILFQGDATVTNGVFDAEFILPKNINYSFGEGRISFYAVNDTYTTDAHGAYANVSIGGSENNTTKDQTAPEVDLFLNDITFASGQSIGGSAILLAHLKDENGINTSSTGFGNEIVMYLDDQEPLALNEFYTASRDTYKEGWLSFPMDDLEKGSHTLTLEVSDVFNNETQTTIEFFVTEENGIQLSNVYTYPNPVTSSTDEITLSFELNTLGEDLNVGLKIINLQGAEIINETYRFENVSENKLQIKWDLRNGSGSRVEKGMYIYKLTVQSLIDGSKSQAHRKILILD